MKRVGVLGGTFDPIHLGHLAAASEVLGSFDLDRVLFMPAGDPWQKTTQIPAEDRFMMTELAISGSPSFAVSRLEIDRKGPTYTADSFETLRGFYGDDVRFFLILGADALLNLPTWRKLDRLRELVEIIAVSRPGFDLGAFHQDDALPPVHLHEIPGIDISAHEIRALVRNGESIASFVPSAVADYIHSNGLYAERPTERSA